jgi:hypothetical protein
MKNFLAAILWVTAFYGAGVGSACASDSIRQLVDATVPFSPAYDSNILDLGKTKALVIKGYRETGTAGGGDVFQSLFKRIIIGSMSIKMCLSLLPFGSPHPILAKIALLPIVFSVRKTGKNNLLLFTFWKLHEI